MSLSSLNSRFLYTFKTLQTAIQRSVYSGPHPITDYTVFKDDSSWEMKKLKNIRQRVIDHNKKTLPDGEEIYVDDDARRIRKLPHLVFTDNPKQYDVEGFDLQHIIGKSFTPKEQKRNQVNNLDPDFAKPEVQQILISLTGKDLEKVFKKKQAQSHEMPQVRLMTEEQLKQQFETASKRADSLLEIPPVMLERSPINEQIAYDPDIDGYEHCSIVFTDISENITHDERFVVVRETDGKLRKASWEERDRILLTYFPNSGRKIIKPLMFDDLSNAFKNKLHENVLEQILVQFEPDSPEFIRFTRQVYDDINENDLFDLLRSTRFFGGLAFYLTKYQSIDKLLLYFINNRLITEAKDLVRLFTLIKPESKTAEFFSQQSDEMKILEKFFSNDAKDRSSLSKALQKYRTIAPKAAVIS